MLTAQELRIGNWVKLKTVIALSEVEKIVQVNRYTIFYQ
jgi:hypothetical protein